VNDCLKKCSKHMATNDLTDSCEKLDHESCPQKKMKCHPKQNFITRQISWLFNHVRTIETKDDAIEPQPGRKRKRSDTGGLPEVKRLNRDLQHENEFLRQENMELIKQNEDLAQEKEDLQKEEDVLLRENVELMKENQELKKRNDDLAYEKDVLQEEKKVLQQDNGELIKQNEERKHGLNEVLSQIMQLVEESDISTLIVEEQ
jgi:chromosome segregation ATPase